MNNVADTNRELLTPMILYYVMNRGLATCRQLQEDLNKFMHIGILDLQNTMRAIATEHKLVLWEAKLPLKQGNFGAFLTLAPPKSEQC